jgi:hypothetical protein
MQALEPHMATNENDQVANHLWKTMLGHPGMGMDSQTMRHPNIHEYIPKTARDTETQRHRDTETEILRDRETERHRDTKTRRHRDTKTQRHRDTKTQRHSDTHTQHHTTPQHTSKNLCSWGTTIPIYTDTPRATQCMGMYSHIILGCPRILG